MSELRLGPFEEKVLLAIATLAPEAYGARILEFLEAASNQPVSLGAIYTTLDRLQRKGLVTSARSAPLPQPGGRSRRLYQLSGTGAQVLHATQQARRRLERLAEGGTA